MATTTGEIDGERTADDAAMTRLSAASIFATALTDSFLGTAVDWPHYLIADEWLVLETLDGGDVGMSGRGAHPLAVVAIETVPTAVFLVELSSIGWLVGSGLIGRRDRTVALAAAAVAMEAVVFFGNDRVCPLTPLTERLGATRGSVSDIFRPDVVARTIPIWSSALVGLAALLHARTALRLREEPGQPDV